MLLIECAVVKVTCTSFRSVRCHLNVMYSVMRSIIVSMQKSRISGHLMSAMFTLDPLSRNSSCEKFRRRISNGNNLLDRSIANMAIPDSANISSTAVWAVAITSIFDVAVRCRQRKCYYFRSFLRLSFIPTHSQSIHEMNLQIVFFVATTLHFGKCAFNANGMPGSGLGYNDFYFTIYFYDNFIR